jgi:peptidyl-prolyl cis-trans isomerase SurA
MKYFIKYLILIIFLLFFHTVFAVQKNNSEFAIVAKVNNEIITKYDVDNRYNLISLVLKEMRKKEDNQRIYKQALEQLIDDKIKEQDILKKEIVLEEDAVANYILFLLRQQKMSEYDLKEYLRKNGVNYDNYLYKIKNDLLWTKLIEQNIQRNIFVSDYEVNEAVEYIIKNSNRTRYNISEIFIPISKRESKSDIKHIADELVAEIKKNNNFEAVVGRFSRSSTAENLGNIGWVDEQDINVNIFNLIKHLKIGEISKPLFIQDNNNGGYYIFKLNDKKTQRIIKDKEIERIKEILYNQKLNVAIKKYWNELYRSAFIEIL